MHLLRRSRGEVMESSSVVAGHANWPILDNASAVQESSLQYWTGILHYKEGIKEGPRLFERIKKSPWLCCYYGSSSPPLSLGIVAGFSYRRYIYGKHFKVPTSFGTGRRYYVQAVVVLVQPPTCDMHELHAR